VKATGAAGAVDPALFEALEERRRDEALPEIARELCVLWQAADDTVEMRVVVRSTSPLLSGGRDPATVDLLCGDLLVHTR
jgi:hypothetical protein